MNKFKGRAAQRGSHLDKNCYRATISNHEYGLADDRKFCYGLSDGYPDELLEKCKKCGAYCKNATPLILKEET